MSEGSYVLVVDDDPSILELVTDILGIEGYRTQTTPSGRHALEIAERSRPAAILLDLVMPEMSGWEFLQRYHSTSRDPAPVIALTGLHDRSRLPIEVREIVAKPFHIDELIEKLERLAAQPELVAST